MAIDGLGPFKKPATGSLGKRQMKNGELMPVDSLPALERDVNQQFMSYDWDGVAGCEDVLESSNDLVNWTPAFGPVYGVGQKFSVALSKIKLIVPPAGSIPIPQITKPFYNFSIVVFPGSPGLVIAKLGVRSNDVAAVCVKNWASLSWLSLGIFDIQLGSDPAYSLMIVKRQAFANETPPSTPVLSPADAAKLAKLEDAFEMVKTSTYRRQQQAATIATQNAKKFFRIKRTTLDSDEDHIPDYKELEWNKSTYATSYSNPDNWDSDGDGISDLCEDWDADGMDSATELACGKNPGSANVNSFPPNTPEHPDRHLDWRQDPDVGTAYQPSYVTMTAFPVLDWGWRFDLQFRKYGETTWQSISPQEHLVSILPSPYYSGRYDYIFRSPINQPKPIANAYANQYLRVEIHPPGFNQTLEHTIITAANLKANSDACIAEIIKTADRRWVDPSTLIAIPGSNPLAYPAPKHSIRDIFLRNLSGSWPSNTAYNPNQRAAWDHWGTAQHLDLTGVAWEHEWPIKSQAEITLISPIHGLMTRHQRDLGGSRPVGSEVVFHDNLGNPHKRKILKSRAFHWNRTGTNSPGSWYFQDIVMVTLDTPVPTEVAVYPVLAVRNQTGNLIPWQTHLNGAWAVATNKEWEFGIYKLYIDGNMSNPDPNLYAACSLSRIPPIQSVPVVPSSLHWRSDINANGEDGESGGGVYMFHKGQQVLLGLVSAGGFPAFCTWLAYHGHHSRLNEWMAQDSGG